MEDDAFEIQAGILTPPLRNTKSPPKNALEKTNQARNPPFTPLEAKKNNLNSDMSPHFVTCVAP